MKETEGLWEVIMVLDKIDMENRILEPHNVLLSIQASMIW